MVFLEKPDPELLYKETRATLRIDNKDRIELMKILSAILLGEEYELSIKKHSKRNC